MFFLPSYTGFLSPKSWGLKCCTMYSTTSLQVATQKQNGIRTTETGGDQLNMSPIRNSFWLGEGSPWEEYWSCRMQLVGTFHGHKVYERTKKREAVRWGMPFNAWLPWPSFNHGGATFHWKGKVKGPDLCGLSLNLCLPPLKQKQPIVSPFRVEPSPEMFKNVLL